MYIYIFFSSVLSSGASFFLGTSQKHTMTICGHTAGDLKACQLIYHCACQAESAHTYRRDKARQELSRVV